MNIKLRAKRINRWAAGNPQPPVRIELHPTDRCNLNCRFCWRQDIDFEPEKELSKSKLLDIVDEAAEMGVKEWIISGGGEPMVRKEATLEIMERIKEKDMWGQLTTNGTLFKREDVERVVNAGWDQVQISINGPDAETHNFIARESTAFQRAIKTSKLFAELKEKEGKNNPYVGFNSIITRQSHDKLRKIIETAHQAQSQLVYFEPIYPGYTSHVRMELNQEEKKKVAESALEVKKKAKELGVNTNIEQFSRPERLSKSDFKRKVERAAPAGSGFKSVACYQPWYLMGIKGCGLAGCCSTFEQGVDIHNKKLKEAWYSDTFSELRQEMLRKDLPDYCSKCSVVVMKENEQIRERLKRNNNGLLDQTRRFLQRLVTNLR